MSEQYSFNIEQKEKKRRRKIRPGSHDAKKNPKKIKVDLGENGIYILSMAGKPDKGSLHYLKEKNQVSYKYRGQLYTIPL